MGLEEGGLGRVLSDEGGYWAEELLSLLLSHSLSLSLTLACSQWMCMCSRHRKPLIPTHTAVLWRRREIIKTVSIGPHLKGEDKLCCACCRVYPQQLCVLGIHTQSRNGFWFFWRGEGRTKIQSLIANRQRGRWLFGRTWKCQGIWYSCIMTQSQFLTSVWGASSWIQRC